MPIMTTQTRFLDSFLFRLVVRGEMTTAMTVEVDPFTGTLWIGRAHSPDRPTWAELLDGHPRIDVQLLHRDKTVARTIRVQYEGLDWQPLHLDARRDDVAMEWAGLISARYSLVDPASLTVRRERCVVIRGLPDGVEPRMMGMEDGKLIVLIEHDSFDLIEDGCMRPTMEFQPAPTTIHVTGELPAGIKSPGLIE